MKYRNLGRSGLKVSPLCLGTMTFGEADIGCSNYAAYRLVESQWVSKTQHLERFVSAQMQYSLVTRDIEREVVPVCEQYGLGILPWSPLAGGFLSGKYKQSEKPPSGSRLEQWKDRFGRFDTGKNWEIIDTVVSVATELDTSPAAVALAWLLRKPAVTSVIFGARSIEQLDKNVAAAELELPDAMMKKLDEVSAPKWGYPYEFIANVQGRW